MLWLFARIPTQLGITAAGVAMKKAAVFDLGQAAPAKVRWLLCGALGIAMLGVALIDSVTERKQAELGDRARVNMRMTSALVILLMAPVGGTMPGWLFLGIVTAMCFAQVIFDLMMAPLADDGHHGQGHLIADQARAAAADGRAVPAPDVSRVGEVIRRGTPSELRRDLYFYLMEGSWFRVVASLGFLYLVANVVFASLYMLEPGCIANAKTDSFADAFFFSVQTMSTIGYGYLSPATPYGNLIVTLQAGLCLIMVALATGLMFAKASRPRASVMFSESIVLTTRFGKPTLMFRVGNARGNEIVDANLLVSVLCDEMTPEGDHMRRLYDLKLERSRQPFFRMTWSVMHVVDAESCLFGQAGGTPTFIAIIAILTGHDGTYGQTVFARHQYTPDKLRVGHRFVDVISQLPDGRMMIDYERFHDTVPET
ncbi:MAG: ion channel [bacterium]